jgi:hypothetical protein
MHDHHEHCCSHSRLKYCPPCDVVYCQDCKREWGQPYDHWVYPYRWYPYRVTWEGDTYTNGGGWSISATNISATTIANKVATACKHE